MEKELRISILSIIIIKLIINLKSWYYHSCSGYDYVLRAKKLFSVQSDKFENVYKSYTKNISM